MRLVSTIAVATSVLNVKDANGGETNYSYYKDNKTASIKDAVGNKTEYTYDVAGRLTNEILGSLSREYKYDRVNNRTQTTDRNSRTTNYAYDNLNRITTDAWADGSKTFTYSYDKNGNRLTADDGKIKYVNSYDKTDLLETVDRFDDGNLNPQVSFNYTYDEIGNLTQTQEVANSIIKVTTAYEYDDRYLNTKITQKGAGLANKTVKFTYNATGENTKIERYLDGLLKVTTDNAYDIYGRLTGIAQVKGITPTNPTGTPISDDVYVLDNLNRLQTQTKGGQVKEIGYDKTDQVQTVTGGAGEAYTYDLNGNRTNGGYTTGVDNRLTSDGTYSYLYDPEGNRQSRTKISDGAVDEYTWDYRNRLTGIVSKDSGGAVIKTVGYTYDVDDQRVSKTVTSTPLSAGTTGTGSTTEKYYLDGNQIAFVTDGGGNQMFHYLYGLNVDQVMAQDSPAGMVWALADRLGSIDTITDGEGVVVDRRTFDSFGRVLSETNPSVSFRYGYTGRELDLESGLNYYRARYYDSQVGRFISVDPAGFGAGDTNLYRYVGNSSTMATDPTGMWSLQEAWNGAGQLWNNGVQTVGDIAYDGVVKVDRVVAGLANFATGGYSEQLRNHWYGDRIAGQSDSFEYALGQSVGFGITTVLGALAPATLGGKVGVAGRVAQGYLIAQTFQGAYDTTTKIKDGQMDWSSPLSYLEVAGSFAPLIGAGASAAARQLGKLGVVQNALAKATSVAENTYIFAKNRVTDARIILDPKIKFSDNISSYEHDALKLIKNEAVQLSRSDSNIGKSYTDRIASGEKTVAYADIEINGSNHPTLGSVSGGKDFGERVLRSRVGDNYAVPDYAKNLTSDSKLTAYKVNSKHGVRNTDAEIKVLEQVFQMTVDTPNVTGKIRMVIDRNSCYSCQKVALDFRKLRPGIELEFVYASDSKPLNAIYNKLRNSF